MKPETLLRLGIFLLLLAVIALPTFFWARTPLLHARVAEAGGWMPTTLHAEVNRPLHLRLTSDDVVHGFAVGQMDFPAVDIYPGRVSEVTLVFNKPGTYTFYCTRWCGLNHWRMRGTIEVHGNELSPHAAPGAPPLYVTLALNLDAPHLAAAVPATIPSAERGRALAEAYGLRLSAAEYRSHSPYQVFVSLESLPLTPAERWDIVAYLWQSNTTLQALAEGQRLYAQNCAACHGEQGAGDGVFADDLAQRGVQAQENMAGAVHMTMQSPLAFTDAARLLGASPALLQGKILRGGMGTGMPSWGAIFTEEQTWALVAYLYTFSLGSP